MCIIDWEPDLWFYYASIRWIIMICYDMGRGYLRQVFIDLWALFYAWDWRDGMIPVRLFIFLGSFCILTTSGVQYHLLVLDLSSNSEY